MTLTAEERKKIRELEMIKENKLVFHTVTCRNCKNKVVKVKVMDTVYDYERINTYCNRCLLFRDEPLFGFEE